MNIRSILLIGFLSIFIFYACRRDNQLGHEGEIAYYFNSESGHDANSGISAKSPFKTLERIKSIKLAPGDRILLAAGQEFRGSLILDNVSGSKENPVQISSYRTGQSTSRALINAKGYPNAILLKNCNHVEIQNLMLTADGKGQTTTETNPGDMRCGLLVMVTREGNFSHIRLDNLSIKDVYYENRGFERPEGEVITANGTQSYGWGIRVINNTEDAVLSDVQIHSCTIENVGHTGIKLTSLIPGDSTFGIRSINISGNTLFATGGPGIQMSGVSNGYISENFVDGSGSNDDSRKWGRGSGLWTWGSRDIVIEKNHFINAKGPGDSAGAHIDFNCRNVVLQYNFSANNAGGFCEILGNNYNCAYRYNVSVNDGYRVKGGNNAFQEGKTFWLSGFRGEKERSGPYNSYFYNNSIFVRRDIVSKVAVDRAASGILIANNIFYIEGSSRLVMGDQYKPDKGGESKIKNVVFENNLYFDRYSWPENVLIQDLGPILGDPGFIKPGGMSVDDYIPTNMAIIKDKGIVINRIPMDSIGLAIGLEVKYDILGNEITGTPDLGAIEMH